MSVSIATRWFVFSIHSFAQYQVLLAACCLFVVCFELEAVQISFQHFRRCVGFGLLLYVTLISGTPSLFCTPEIAQKVSTYFFLRLIKNSALPRGSRANMIPSEQLFSSSVFQKTSLIAC
jgi:hypothetical protein